MFNKELVALTNLGTQFAQSFKDLTKATITASNEQISTIYSAASKLDEISAIQNALFTAGREITKAIKQAEEPLGQSIDRIDTVLGNIDDMDWALEIEPDLDEIDEDENEELGE